LPKLPRGMFKRGRSYYVRVRENYGDRWVCLGPDREAARKRHRELKSGWRPMSRLTVEDAAKQWLEIYIATRRNAKCVELAGRRAAMYLVPFFQYKRLATVTAGAREEADLDADGGAHSLGRAVFLPVV